MARVAGTKREAKPVDATTAEVIEYLSVKTETARLEKRMKALRDSLIATVEQVGYEDADGHQWIDLNPEVVGISAIQRQRRVSRGTDMEAAEEVLKGLELWEKCTKTVRVLDEDAIYAALSEQELTDADIDTIFPQTVTWALVTKK